MKNKYNPSQKQNKRRQDTNLPAQKKKWGQHFLISQDPINTMLSSVTVTPETVVVEIGCGNGILSRAILEHTPCKALHIIEIDHEWADHVGESIHDERVTIHRADAIMLDFQALFGAYERVVLMANLPYLITFPLFEKLSHYPHLFAQGMVMLQEEAAQRIASTSGKRYGAVSIFLQHSFEFTLSDKVRPELFSPRPAVMSRLVAFKPRHTQIPLPESPDLFWAFVRSCFTSPRQTLKNNLKGTKYPLAAFSEQELGLRAQQMTLQNFIDCWNRLQKE